MPLSQLASSRAIVRLGSSLDEMKTFMDTPLSAGASEGTGRP